MATIRKRKDKDGNIRYTIEIRKKGQKGIIKTFGTEEECLKFEKEHLQLLKEGYASINLPLAVYIDRYIQEKMKDSRSTFLFEFWKNELGSLFVSEITDYHIERVIDKFAHRETRKKCPPSQESIRKLVFALGAVFNLAIKEWKWCKTNPVVNVSSKYRKQKPHIVRLNQPRLLEDFKQELKEAFEVKLIGKTPGERMKILGLQKTTYQNFFKEGNSPMLKTLIEVLNRIGLKLEIIEQEIPSD